MSLKGDKYETTEEVKFRLENTVVLYEGKPVLISRVKMPEEREEAKEIARVYFYELPYGAGNKKNEVRRYLSSRNFDLAPFKMGYFNHGGEAIFASRTPVRQNKQGLGQTTCKLTDIRGKGCQTLDWNGVVGSQGFVDMVNGKFPDFQAAGEMLGNKENGSVALSRSFAFFIDHDLEALLLMHKGVKCGLALRGQKALQIPPKFHFLREEMEECRIPIA